MSPRRGHPSAAGREGNLLSLVCCRDVRGSVCYPSPRMGAREWLVACAVVFCATASGCLGCNNSDLGLDCILQKANPDGGKPVPMTGSDITADGQDIISLG